MEELDQKSALKILVNAIQVGQSRGAWKLEEVPTLLKAIEVFTTPPQQPQTNVQQQKPLQTVNEEQHHHHHHHQEEH